MPRSAIPAADGRALAAPADAAGAVEGAVSAGAAPAAEGASLTTTRSDGRARAWIVEQERVELAIGVHGIRHVAGIDVLRALDRVRHVARGGELCHDLALLTLPRDRVVPHLLADLPLLSKALGVIFD